MISEKIEAIKTAVMEELAKSEHLQDIQDIRVKFLGKKGELTAIMKEMKNLSKEDRPKVGQLVNTARNAIEEQLNAKLEEVKAKELAAKIESEKIDITLPGRKPVTGHEHPLHQTLRLMEDSFLRMGFSIVEGTDIESDYYNFQCLNLPEDHPARDMQDSMYITDNILLRTHTSGMQARTLQSHKPNEPFKIIAPGKVYRCDYDATHSPVFHQMEGMIIDKNIRFSDLKGMLEDFLRDIFGEDTKVRFRASYFPFTEPSAEVDISCVMCGGEGCRVCSHTGWLEILGCGMVNPNVLRLNGYDPDVVTGFAFGMGVERIAMLKYGIDDLRLFYENDMRFLNQF
ncbi:MAG: phenylalanine--tRNA ligase subunit alpha [Megasphaera massiliensis]|jgi:phenylalanyl-tRNA synthetase alpha chain|uniref:phenylalanine--tRNA ligase subunit alpha n=1 Tax=Megasphaera massiliensis TaxID=1232428 RepID=UPI002A75C57E|nr:phenylalanine--tRNA ligase subunit alpha [Megasphaera massiliensis]MDY2966171.1 phenylalanine--tRNA ligase subunit alpha [Megasphaera massiliensis]